MIDEVLASKRRACFRDWATQRHRTGRPCRPWDSISGEWRSTKVFVAKVSACLVGVFLAWMLLQAFLNIVVGWNVSNL